jgi:hypothetical protein
MNKIIFKFAIAITGALLIFIFGFYLGGSYCNSFTNKSVLKERFHQYIDSSILLNFLDNNDLEAARELLVNEQDVSILTVDNLANSLDLDSYKVASDYMRIAYKHRRSHPQRYNKYANTSDDGRRVIRARVQATLEKWNNINSKQRGQP